MSIKNKLRTPTVSNRTASSQQNQYSCNHKHIRLQQVQHVQTIFDPEIVRKYGEIVPGAPERILAILEKNNATERTLREKQAESEIEVNRLQAKDNQRRDWMAFLLVSAGLVISAFLHIWNLFGLQHQLLEQLLLRLSKDF